MHEKVKQYFKARKKTLKWNSKIYKPLIKKISNLFFSKTYQLFYTFIHYQFINTILKLKKIPIILKCK